jgi:hypothetical protein
VIGKNSFVAVPEYLDRPLHQYRAANFLNPDMRYGDRIRGYGAFGVNQVAPAPTASKLLCALGTECGLRLVYKDGFVDKPTSKKAAPLMPTVHSVHDLDFAVDNHNVLFTGGRGRRTFMMDVRQPYDHLDVISQPTAIHHLRSVNQYQLLVAGMDSWMALYDLRYSKKDPNPLLKFPEYKNEAHNRIGWDVDVASGVVAAAHDDGTVALFSLHSGKRLRSPVIDKVHESSSIRALQFQALPWDRHPSLWIPEGNAIQKFSLGQSTEDEE